MQEAEDTRGTPTRGGCRIHITGAAAAQHGVATWMAVVRHRSGDKAVSPQRGGVGGVRPGSASAGLRPGSLPSNAACTCRSRGMQHYFGQVQARAFTCPRSAQGSSPHLCVHRRLLSGHNPRCRKRLLPFRTQPSRFCWAAATHRDHAQHGPRPCLKKRARTGEFARRTMPNKMEISTARARLGCSLRSDWATCTRQLHRRCTDPAQTLHISSISLE